MHLEKVFSAIAASGMTFNLRKCVFCKPKVKVLGHLCGSGTQAAMVDKVQAIKDITYPTTKRALRSFLGAMGFYRKFIPHYADVSARLTDLTRNGVGNKLLLGPEDRAAVDKLKDLLCTATELAAPRFHEPYFLFCDASNRAVGCSLTQLDDGGAHVPIAFASAKLSPTQERWSVSEREAYAIIFGLKQFDYLLYGNHVTVMSDNSVLQYVQKNSSLSPKLFRWGLVIARHNLVVQHLAGVSNPVADMLSRPN
jgi:hypothetical protein